MNERVELEPIDAADVTILVDNSIDLLLPATETVHRAVLATSKRGTLWDPRDQVPDGGLVSSLRALL